MAAKITAADENSFRQLVLNQSVDDRLDPLVKIPDWIACEVDELPPAEGPSYLGIDLGGSLSMSAAVCYWSVTVRLEGWAALPEKPGLTERGPQDKIGDIYLRMCAAGELLMYGERVVDVGAFLSQI